jgi:formylglycine-generating enzyme required for sulfatase activity
MVLIPGGTNAGTDPDFGAYSLTVTPFYMDKHEVTKAQWDQVYAWAITNGYRFDAAGSGVAPNHPVQQVIWYDCVKWCNARSQKEGRPVVYTVNGAVYKAGRSNDVVQAPVAGYRLPTSVEWEYAARGGATGRRFPWSNSDEIQHDRANYNSLPGVEYDTSPSKGWHPAYNDGSTPYTSPVGSFAQNGYGLYDMAGNVWEWCFDWQPNWVGTFRSFRGGSWDDFAGQSRVGFRPTGAPNPILYNVGFRVVLTLNP